MKTLIAYSSRTGNTKMVAQAIGQVIENSQVIDIREKPDPNQYDNIIIGYWADKGRADDLADDFLKTIEGKNCGIFATLGYYPDSDHARGILDYGEKILVENNNQVHKTFICQGKIDPKLIERFKSFPKGHPHYLDEARKKRHQEASSHPDEKDLENAKKTFQDFLQGLGE